jgi:DNA-binding MarR family transcriptional regulator
MTALSAQQQRIYDEIARYQREEGYTPTLRVLGEAIGISQFTVNAHLKKIIDKGRARRINSRHIELS